MKKCMCILLAMLLVLSLGGCGTPNYEDTNGETNFSLQYITDVDIIQGINTFTMMSSTVSLNNTTTCKANTLSGVENLWKRNMKNGKLDMVVSCQITKGNARLVLLIDDTIVHDFSLNEANQHSTMENVSGKVCLKLAGENAGYAVSFTLQ